MAKKFVRGITDVKTINNQDFDTNNVNDLLSDGQYNYIHRKKGKTEEYHNLTDNIKTISSDNTELLTVTNNNKTTNSATLHPKHDAQKEQLLESTRNTIAINHGTNGTAEKTTVDTNPKKVLEHENLISSSQYVTIEHVEDSNTSEIKTDNLDSKLIELNNKIPKSIGTVNLFKGSRDFSGSDWINNVNGVYAEDYQGVKIFKTQAMWDGRSQSFEVKAGEEYVFSAYVKSSAETDRVTFYLPHSSKQPQAGGIVSSASTNSPHNVSFDLTDEYQRIAIKIKIDKAGWIAPRIERSDSDAYLFFGGYKLENGNVATDYSPNPEDVNTLLAQKQDKLTAGDGITIEGQTISYSGTTSTIQKFTGDGFGAYKHVVQSGGQILTTFVFDCYSGTAEHVITGELKEQLKLYVLSGLTFSNGAITLTNDGTNIKLTNSNSTENVYQQGTFTFYTPAGGGGFIS